MYINQSFTTILCTTTEHLKIFLQYIINNLKKWNQDDFKLYKRDESGFRNCREDLRLFIIFQFIKYQLANQMHRQIIETRSAQNLNAITPTLSQTFFIFAFKIGGNVRKRYDGKIAKNARASATVKRKIGYNNRSW